MTKFPRKFYVETGKQFIIENICFDDSFKGIMQLGFFLFVLATWAQFRLLGTLSYWNTIESCDT